MSPWWLPIIAANWWVGYSLDPSSPASAAIWLSFSAFYNMHWYPWRSIIFASTDRRNIHTPPTGGRQTADVVNHFVFYGVAWCCIKTAALIPFHCALLLLVNKWFFFVVWWISWYFLLLFSPFERKPERRFVFFISCKDTLIQCFFTELNLRFHWLDLRKWPRFSTDVRSYFYPLCNNTVTWTSFPHKWYCAALYVKMTNSVIHSTISVSLAVMTCFEALCSYVNISF